jgi:Mn2+/Fe2+ NRAMP family transporter
MCNTRTDASTSAYYCLQTLLLLRANTITALIPALIVTVTLQGNTTAADKMSQWLNVLQSVQLPFALIPLIHFCSRCVLYFLVYIRVHSRYCLNLNL